MLRKQQEILTTSIQEIEESIIKRNNREQTNILFPNGVDMNC